MKVRSKRYKALLKLYDKTKKYTLDEAIEILKKFTTTKFDQTVNLSIKLGIDPQRGDQQVRGSASLVNGTGKVRKVLVFAEGEEAEIAKQSGADYVGGQDLVKKIEDGWMDFDVVIASPKTMKYVSKLGKILGRKGLMPSPKDGTVTDNLAQAVKDCKYYRVVFKNNKFGDLNVPVGKLSFEPEKLKENILSFLETLKAHKPPTAKGQFLRSIYISASMSPSIKLSLT